jgi:hypothetical protein
MNVDPNTPASPNGAPAPGLPPVTPPSGRFIAQLFLVPGMIVLVAVLIILAINYLFVGGYTPEYFLGKLDSDNADIRWRGASDLAQWIKRKESQQLKTDAGFALDLAARLRIAVDDLLAAEKSVAALPPDEQARASRKLRAQSDYVEYLASALGDFYVPVGAPILCEIVTRETGANVASSTMRRRRAIWALANLGANVKAFTADVKEDKRGQILDQLRSEAAGADPQRAAWARTALYYASPAEVSDIAGITLVDHALAKAARSQDRYLREHVAMALNFWDGDQVEATLVRLARDNGFGTLIRIGED